MEKFIDTFQGSLGNAAPGLIGALGILLVGWILAVIVKTVLQKTLKLCNVNKNINASGSKESKMDLEGGIAKGGYLLVLLLTLLAVFNQLNLNIASEPIQMLVSQVMAFIPNLIGGAVLILVAWLCSKICRQIVSGALVASGVDEKIQSGKNKTSQIVGDIAYWFILLMFLPAILGVFELEGLLAPAQSMIDKIMNMLPNILGAGIIVFAGWFIAKVLSEIMANISVVAGLDTIGDKAGIKGKSKLSSIVGKIVFFFIFVPAIIAGLKALEISVIADPATHMLNIVMASIPNIVAAVAILLVTYFVAKPVTGLLISVLASLGFDRLPENMGFKNLAKGKISPSEFVGKVVFFFMILFATVEAANRLEFTLFSAAIDTLIQFGGQVVLGSVIIAAGVWIANLVSDAISKTTKGSNPTIVGLVRGVILTLVIAMGLRSMGLANDIVNMAFLAIVISTGSAFALSFGIGGREAAGKQMEYWFKKLRNEK